MPKRSFPFSKFVNAEPTALRGISWMLLATATAALQNALIKFMSHGLPFAEVLFFRSLFSLGFFMPAILYGNFTAVKTKRMTLHCVRGGVHGCAQILFFFALATTPLAVVAVLNFTGPLFSTLLAALFLGEVVRARRITALALGFAGAMVVLRPGFIEIELGAIATLVSAFFWGMSLMCMKILTRTESSLTISLYGLFFSLAISLAFTIPNWHMPTLGQFFWLVVMGGINAISQFSRTQAIKEADLSLIMPLDFTRLVWVSILGYVFFGEVPDIWTWLGGIIIFASATYIAYRERHTRNTPAKPA
ncbi:MAG: DMT family transporter [Rhodospirillales bacterium]